MQVLTMLKGIPTAYNRDLQEDKPPIFDAADTVAGCLRVASEVLATARFNRDRIGEGLDRGFLDATALADYLVLKGVPFREAHGVVGGLVKDCLARRCRLCDLGLEDFRKGCSMIGEDVYEVLGPANCVKHYRSHGSTQPSRVKAELRKWREKLKGGLGLEA
jgi:argininosuccinate lyase